MKYFITLIFCFAIMLSSVAQQVFPGGVRAPVHWYVTDDRHAKISFRNLTDSTIALPLSEEFADAMRLNNYPSLRFAGNAKLSIPLGSDELSSASYFTVYQPFNVSSENIIWHFLKDARAGLVLTTSRMADLEIYKYINYTDIVPLNPKVNTYIQHKQKDSMPPLSQFLQLSGMPDAPRLPVVPFKGLIPEIIIYNRALDWQEQLRVASYLALKYGITLTEPGASYLNSAGQKVWDGDAYSKYHHNIAGIGRDDSSGLLQKTASSSNHPGLLSVSTTDSLNDKDFLLWGDNNLPLVSDEPLAGVPPLLQRKWLTVTQGVTKSVSTQVIIDTREMDVALPAKPVYWLASDRTGTGDFSLPETEFFKMSRPVIDGKAYFNGITLNKTGTGKDVIGFVAAQDLLLSCFIANPACANPSGGSLQLKVWGGKPPYTLQVIKDGASANQFIIADNHPLMIPGIAAGCYTLTVHDRDGHVYTDRFYVNNSDAPLPSGINKRYVLYEGQHLQLDAAIQMPDGLMYEWKGPDLHSSDPKVTLKQAGLYTLSVSKNGCAYLHQFVVSRPPKNAFKSVKAYPNPSSGLFTVSITIDKPSPVTMNIYTEDGKLVASKNAKGFANYTFTEQLNDSGLYYLVFTSGLSKTTEKIIIGR